MKNPSSNFAQRIFCDSDRIQTCNLLIRSQMLYSVELRSRYFSFASAKVYTILLSRKFLGNFFQKKLDGGVMDATI